MKLIISLYLDEVDTLDDVDIDDDVETELDVETLGKIAEDYHFIFQRFCLIIKKFVSTITKLIAFSLLIVGFLRRTLQTVRDTIKFIATLKNLTHLMMLILTMMSTQNLKLRH